MMPWRHRLIVGSAAVGPVCAWLIGDVQACYALGTTFIMVVILYRYRGNIQNNEVLMRWLERVF